MSLLSLAASTLDIRTAESLLNHGALDTVLYPVGRGALAHALDATCSQSVNEADLDSFVGLLVRHGVDINALSSSGVVLPYRSDNNVATWMHNYLSGMLLVPSLNGSVALIINSYQGTRGTTALMYTISRRGDPTSLAHCVEVLCNNGAKVNVLDKSGTSAFTLAFICLEEGREKFHIERILLDYSD
jgi:ankyrin repeat protein